MGQTIASSDGQYRMRSTEAPRMAGDHILCLYNDLSIRESLFDEELRWKTRAAHHRLSSRTLYRHAIIIDTRNRGGRVRNMLVPCPTNRRTRNPRRFSARYPIQRLVDLQEPRHRIGARQVAEWGLRGFGCRRRVGRPIVGVGISPHPGGRVSLARRPQRSANRRPRRLRIGGTPYDPDRNPHRVRPHIRHRIARKHEVGRDDDSVERTPCVGIRHRGTA